MDSRFPGCVVITILKFAIQYIEYKINFILYILYEDFIFLNCNTACPRE